MDPAQILLSVIIGALSILLIILGIQVFFILREIRKALTKTNKVLDYTESITESVSKPISQLSSLTTGLKIGSIIAKILTKKKHHGE
ncbi:MAG TPA: hypothetical protein VGT05_02445 [Patescibacteria group bacterium]|nr:hypothetical protein [Patescibacteria group bacterium]